MKSLVQLEQICRRLGELGRRKYTTIANALVPFILYLRDTARVEKAPPWEDRFPINILDREGAPPNYRSCIDGMLDLRFQARAAQQGYTEELRRVLLYDEAGLEFGREFTAQSGSGYVSHAKRSITQRRSYGVGMILSDQSFSELMEEAKRNANTAIALRMLAAQDINEVGQRLNLNDSQRQRMPQLGPGRGLILTPGLDRAAEIQFPDIRLGNYPSAAEIEARMGPVLSELRREIVFTPERPIRPLDLEELLPEEPAANDQAESAEPPAPFDGTLLVDQMAFLRDVSQFAQSGVVERFRRLGFGGSKGNRIKQELIDLGLLEVVEVRKSAVGASTKVLRLTVLARTLPNL